MSLLTDFGLEDAYVGVMKGVMLSHNDGVRCVDLSHGVAPQAVLQAAWLLAHAWRRFPDGTTHLAVVDPGVGSGRRILVAEDAGHAFLAPDNGLLGPVLSEDARVFELDADRFALPNASRTFHGRDVFAPAAAALASGMAPEELGEPTDDWLQAGFPGPEVLEDGWRTEVLFADRFGNLITPLTLPARLLEGEDWCARVAGRAAPLVGTYAEVEPGVLLALFGSCGSLEVSLRDGDARAELAVQSGEVVTLRRMER
ncbi:MAG: SAM-dependent chlorinase/fluorinase [Planctomycetes bacterium]|nr:SAM-dependent chlorinase/fluorinase [Planctomycetota bacterium]MCB9904262.1 SAM-dependent chlorinase/fluorinase [Planctomycetota bacterium]